MTSRKIEYWVIPPEADAEFVAGMEEVLDTYAAPYDPASGAVHGRAAGAIAQGDADADPGDQAPSPPGRLRVRAGRHGEHLHVLRAAGGLAEVAVRERRTKVDWAVEVAALLRARYAKARNVILVCDNLNTHTQGAFYEAFPPPEARALVRRLEFRHTPKHGSWLNIAENELSALTRQCLRGRRFGTVQELRRETAAWQQRINDKQRGVDWQFRIDDARTKLKSLYPKLPV